MRHSPPSPSAFDAIADSYDASFDGNWVARSLRAQIWELLRRTFHRGDHVLELNCGTGTDALFLAEHGVRVTGIDSSPRMIELATQKAEERMLDKSVAFRVLNFEELGVLGRAAFDGMYSNFGGLNCAADIGSVFRETSNILKKDAPVIASLLNKWCLWETMGFLFRGKVNHAFRRWRNGPTHAFVGAHEIELRYYSIGEIISAASPFYRISRVQGLSIVSPPPGSASFIRRYPSLVNLLLNCDRRIADYPILRAIGDHYVVEGIKRR